MPVPAPTHPCSTAPSRALPIATGGVGRLDLHGARIVQPAVVAFADDRDHDVVDPDCRVGLARSRDGTVEDPADGHRRGEKQRGLDHAPLGDLEEAGQLSCPVQGCDPRSDRATEQRQLGPGQDCRDAGAGDSSSLGRRRLVARHRHVADADTRNIGDRVDRTCFELPYPEAVPAQRRLVHTAEPTSR